MLGIGITLMITLGGQNRPLLLGMSIHERVKRGFFIFSRLYTTKQSFGKYCCFYLTFYMIKQFVANNLVLNLGKTNIMKFITKNSSHSTLHIGYREKYVEGKMNTQFLGLQTDNNINWKTQIEQIIPKLSVACYVMSMVHIINIITLKSIYNAHFHSII